MVAKVTVLVLALLASSLAQQYSDEDQHSGAQQHAPTYVARQPYHDLYEHAKAEPYDFGFQSTDEFGTVMNRQEASDNTGAVRGSYGYTDPFGVFRHVDYIADEFGFRAQVKSNEPGMGRESPANVEIYAEPPPAGVVVERPPYHHNPHQIHAASNPQPQGQPPRRNPQNVNQQRPPQQQYQQQQQQQQQQSSRIPATTTTKVIIPGSPGPFPFSTNRQNPYPLSRAQEGFQAGPRYSGQTSYPPRSNYVQANQGQSSESIASASSSSSSASSASASNVNTGYTVGKFPVGNPHITSFVKKEGGDKAEGSSIILPTVVASGVPTLVKHIHTYPINV